MKSDLEVEQRVPTLRHAADGQENATHAWAVDKGTRRPDSLAGTTRRLPRRRLATFKANPIIGRHYMPGVQGVYNSAVAPYGDGFVGVFRLEKRTRFPHLHMGWSDDGIDWQIEPEPIEFAKGDPTTAS